MYVRTDRIIRTDQDPSTRTVAYRQTETHQLKERYLLGISTNLRVCMMDPTCIRIRCQLTPLESIPHKVYRIPMYGILRVDTQMHLTVFIILS